MSWNFRRILPEPKSNSLSVWQRDIKGSTAMMFALLGPLLLGAAGIAIDFATFSLKQSSLQAAADAAALGGAKQLSLATSKDSIVKSAALSLVSETLKGKDDAAVGTATIDRPKGSITVHISESWTPFFAQYIGADITPVTAVATASLVGESKLCLLTLESKSAKGLQMLQSAHLQASGCSVYSNSTNPNGIFINDSATIDSAMICSAGGVKNKNGSTTVPVSTDCPPLADPLLGHSTPTIAGCDYNTTNLRSGSVVLRPGVYCGGIDLADTVQVKFEPGTYILKDGQFKVADTATVQGTDVSFFFSGAKSFITFIDNASINLSGAETGDMAGLLFFNDPTSGTSRIHVISAKNAKTLTGTIYLPNSNLKIDPNSSVGEKSAYTAIIVNKLSIEQGPNLVLNSDYAATPVPVPAGIKTGASVVLTN
jgi:Putative Flp pilus-assembly TadE/G-like